MTRLLIRQATIVNEGTRFVGSVVIENEKIVEILAAHETPETPCPEVIEAEGCYLLPGVIDEHVHFRDPGLTHKADIGSESRAAAAGGVTSIMDMPNTTPLTTTLEAWEAKMELMAQESVVNYACYFGATNQNYPLFSKLDRHRVCGIKLFMGSSTGNMLVDQSNSLLHIFEGTDLLIATHCEDQQIIKANTDRLKAQYGEDLPLALHPEIRSAEACLRSSELAIALARRAKARLHILHLTTADELALLSEGPLSEKQITAEACIPHLIYTSADYERLGARIKCNPAIKAAHHRAALLAALHSGKIDTIATDHAPHLLSEKEGGALKAMSGMPMIQFSLITMLRLVDEGLLTLEMVVDKMCHAPATIYQINQRGFIRCGYQADLVLVRPGESWQITPEKIQSKCRWSPLEGEPFRWSVERTLVNGQTVYHQDNIHTTTSGQALTFR